MWFPLLLLLLLFFFLPKHEPFKIQVEGDLSGVVSMHRSTSQWVSDYAKRGRAFVWDVLPMKHLYRRWRLNKKLF